MRFLPSSRACGGAAVAGGLLWVLFWTFHTVAHGPDNPAPTDGTFLGLGAMEHARLMMLVAPPLLIPGVGGVARRLGSDRGPVGTLGAGVIALALGAMVPVGAGVGSWALYAASVAGVVGGLLLLGTATLRSPALPRWSRPVPLAMGVALPLLALARLPGSPLLDRGDAVGYLLLESLGLVFGGGWAAMGVALRAAGPSPLPARNGSGGRRRGAARR